MTKNLIVQLKDAATRHPDNAIIQKLIEKLELAQLVVKSNSLGDGSPLLSYELAAFEQDGHDLFLNPPTNLFNDFQKQHYKFQKQAYHLHELAIIADCLVTAFSVVGESF